MGETKNTTLFQGGCMDISPRIFVEINPKFWYSIWLKLIGVIILGAQTKTRENFAVELEEET
jgi:hypothetical protein